MPDFACAIATARPIPLSPPEIRATRSMSFPLPRHRGSSSMGSGVISVSSPGGLCRCGCGWGLSFGAVD